MGKANDKQWGGAHYKQFKGLEPWDVITYWNLGYLDGTALKYIARWKHKNGIEDLKKAIHFLEKAVEVETARLAPASVEQFSNPVGLSDPFWPFDATGGIRNASLHATETGAVKHESVWPFPSPPGYFWTNDNGASPREPAQYTVGGLCDLCLMDEQTGDSVAVCAGHMNDCPLLRADSYE